MKINSVNSVDFDDSTVAVTATVNGTKNVFFVQTVDSKNLEELEEIRKQLMFNKPDYSHIAKESKVAIEITSEEAAAIFYAYDRGFDALDDESKRQLDVVIGKLKYELWP